MEVYGSVEESIKHVEKELEDLDIVLEDREWNMEEKYIKEGCYYQIYGKRIGRRR